MQHICLILMFTQLQLGLVGLEALLEELRLLLEQFQE
jgi:hypothetical protein